MTFVSTSIVCFRKEMAEPRTDLWLGSDLIFHAGLHHYHFELDRLQPGFLGNRAQGRVVARDEARSSGGPDRVSFCLASMWRA
jgi:hypothetical protein